MFERYKSALAEARLDRSRLRVPAFHVPILTIVIVVCVVIALGVAYGSPTLASSQFQEGGNVTKVSAIFMASASVLAAATFLLSRKQPRSRAWFWLLCALAFGYFAMDEVMEFHESLGFALGDDGSEEGPLFFRSWNDVVVIAYGVGALFVCAWFLPEILRLPRFGVLIAVAGAFYVLHTGIDSVFDRSDRSVFLEESSKLFSAAFFALAFLAAVFGMSAWNAREQPRN